MKSTKCKKNLCDKNKKLFKTFLNFFSSKKLKIKNKTNKQWRLQMSGLCYANDYQ